MTTVIKDEVGVEMAGPDEPALAAAKARDVGGDAYLKYTDECRANNRHPLNHEDWASRRQPGNGIPVGRNEEQAQLAHEHGTSRLPASRAERMQDPAYREEVGRLGLMRSGSVGELAQKQAGILPTGRIAVSDEMVHRAMSELARHANPLGASAVRATLEAALHG